LAAHFDGYNIDPWQLGEGEFDLQVNQNFVNWGEYSSTHTYTYPYVGADAPVNFRVFDGDSDVPVTVISDWYGDNSGTLTVDIYGPAIPFPDPFIEPVPANNYNPLGL